MGEEKDRTLFTKIILFYLKNYYQVRQLWVGGNWYASIGLVLCVLAGKIPIESLFNIFIFFFFPLHAAVYIFIRESKNHLKKLTGKDREEAHEYLVNIMKNINLK